MLLIKLIEMLGIVSQLKDSLMVLFSLPLSNNLLSKRCIEIKYCCMIFTSIYKTISKVMQIFFPRTSNERVCGQL